MLTFPIALKNVFVAPHTLGDLIALFIFAMILDSMLARATFMIYLLNVIKEIQQNPMDFTTVSMSVSLACNRFKDIRKCYAQDLLTGH